MKTKNIVLTLLTIGVIFNLIGRANAADVECNPTAPHVSSGPVCMDLTSGPRFQYKKLWPGCSWGRC